MQTATNGMRVWVSILPQRNPADGPRTAGTVEPIALVPGIVVDATPRDRQILGRAQPVQNAVEVISFHRLPSGREFYRKQGQGLIGLNHRDTYAPDIDGDTDAPISRDWLNTLLERVANSQDTIVTPPSDKLLADAIAQFGVQPESKAKATNGKETGQEVAFPTA